MLGQSRRRLNEDANIRSVGGVVTDANNQPVQGAAVQLKDTKSLQIRSFITQVDGKFHFAGLSTNVDYDLKAEYNGKSGGAKRLSLFSSSKAATVNLKISK